MDLEEHIGKGANDTCFPLTPQRVMFNFQYGSFSMSLGTLHETWNLMLKIILTLLVMEAKLVAHCRLPTFYKLKMKNIGLK